MKSSKELEVEALVLEQRAAALRQQAAERLDDEQCPPTAFEEMASAVGSALERVLEASKGGYSHFSWDEQCPMAVTLRAARRALLRAEEHRRRAAELVESNLGSTWTEKAYELLKDIREGR